MHGETVNLAYVRHLVVMIHFISFFPVPGMITFYQLAILLRDKLQKQHGGRNQRITNLLLFETAEQLRNGLQMLSGKRSK